MNRSGIVRGFKGEGKSERAHQFRGEPTAQEALLWEHLRANRLGGFPFRRQQVIDGYIADFYCHSTGLVIELDGAVHADRAEYDAHRDKVMGARGLIVLRFPNHRIERELRTVLTEILTAARQQQARIAAIETED